MPNRREFIQAGLAASILPVAIPHLELPEVAHGPETVTRAVHAAYRVVADVRFPDGIAFALEAERLGAKVVRIRGDITDFWFNDLSLRWKEQPVAIAGLTAHGPIFCLERLAWDHGLRVVFRETHGTVDRGHIEPDEPLISWRIAAPDRT